MGYYANDPWWDMPDPEYDEDGNLVEEDECPDESWADDERIATEERWLYGQ